MGKVSTNTRELIKEMVDVLGSSEVKKAFGVQDRQLFRYISDPRYTESYQNNPFDRMIELFKKLVIEKRKDIIVNSLRVVADRFGIDISDKKEITPDKPTFELEILDDHDHLNNFYQAMINKKNIIEVETKLDIVIDELKQDLEKYKEDLK